MTKDIVPKDSRYIPFTQQAQCCAPTCIQMIMYKNNIPLIPAEELGFHLGLVVPPSEARLFYNARTSETKPPAGYGTRIYLGEFAPNTAFKKLEIPLTLTMHPIANFDTVEDVFGFLLKAEENDKDILFCFNHGALIDDPSRDGGHLVLFDRMIDSQIRIIDPSPTHPKWRNVTIQKMFEAMKKHGEKPTAAGLWELHNLKK